MFEDFCQSEAYSFYTVYHHSTGLALPDQVIWELKPFRICLADLVCRVTPTCRYETGKYRFSMLCKGWWCDASYLRLGYLGFFQRNTGFYIYKQPEAFHGDLTSLQFFANTSIAFFPPSLVLSKYKANMHKYDPSASVASQLLFSARIVCVMILFTG